MFSAGAKTAAGAEAGTTNGTTTAAAATIAVVVAAAASKCFGSRVCDAAHRGGQSSASRLDAGFERRRICQQARACPPCS